MVILDRESLPTVVYTFLYGIKALILVCSDSLSILLRLHDWILVVII